VAAARAQRQRCAELAAERARVAANAQTTRTYVTRAAAAMPPNTRAQPLRLPLVGLEWPVTLAVQSGHGRCRRWQSTKPHAGTEV
jgi:hypothetical protein